MYGLMTHFGRLSYSMKSVGPDIEVKIEESLDIPRGGIIVRSPADRPIKRALVNGKPVTTGKGEVVVRSLPATIRFGY
jgi:hypothetical protein